MKNNRSKQNNRSFNENDIISQIYSQSSEKERHSDIIKRNQISAYMARWFFDHQYNHLLWSDGMFEILELDHTKADADEDLLLHLIHPDDIQLKIKAQHHLRTTSKPLELTYRLVFPDGRIKWINEICSTEFDRDNQPIRSLGTIQDITRYKTAEEKFRQKEKRYKNLIDNLPEGVVISDNSKCVFLNPAAKKILGGTTGVPSSGKNFLAYVHPQSKDEYKRRLKLLLQSNNNAPFTLKMLKQDGSEFVAQLTLSHTIFQGRPSIQIIFSDLNESNLAKDQLIENEKRLQEQLLSRDKFYSIVAHDLRNPMSSLLGIIQLVQKNYPDITDEERIEYLDLMQITTSRTLMLLNELLDWAKMQTGKIPYRPEKHNFMEIASQVKETLLPALKLKNISLLCDFSPDMEITGDNNVIRTVVRNLVHNAIKYSYAGSSITILVSNRNNFTEVTVADQGVGMDRETMDGLFNPDLSVSMPGTHQEEGNGLGLLLCRELIEKYGGKIWAESEFQHGSRFIFTLPAANETRDD